MEVIIFAAVLKIRGFPWATAGAFFIAGEALLLLWPHRIDSAIMEPSLP
jgi:hypothetical protein